MKYFTNFISITFSLLLISASNVKAIEVAGNTKAVASQNNRTIVAQAKTLNKFVTLNRNNTTGTLRIIKENGRQYIELSDDFQTTEGPDLEIILHKNTAVPLNIEEEDYITIAPLKNLQGTQSYLVPENISLDDYASLAIWCKEFNITFGYVQL